MKNNSILSSFLLFLCTLTSSAHAAESSRRVRLKIDQPVLFCLGAVTALTSTAALVLGGLDLKDRIEANKESRQDLEEDLERAHALYRDFLTGAGHQIRQEQGDALYFEWMREHQDFIKEREKRAKRSHKGMLEIVKQMDDLPVYGFVGLVWGIKGIRDALSKN